MKCTHSTCDKDTLWGIVQTAVYNFMFTTTVGRILHYVVM